MGFLGLRVQIARTANQSRISSIYLLISSILPSCFIALTDLNVKAPKALCKSVF